MHQHTLLAHRKSKAIWRDLFRSVLLLGNTFVIKSSWEGSGETWITNLRLPRVCGVVVYLQRQASNT